MLDRFQPSFEYDLVEEQSGIIAPHIVDEEHPNGFGAALTFSSLEPVPLWRLSKAIEGIQGNFGPTVVFLPLEDEFPFPSSWSAETVIQLDRLRDGTRVPHFDQHEIVLSSLGLFPDRTSGSATLRKTRDALIKAKHFLSGSLPDSLENLFRKLDSAEEPGEIKLLLIELKTYLLFYLDQFPNLYAFISMLQSNLRGENSVETDRFIIGDGSVEVKYGQRVVFFTGNNDPHYKGVGQGTVVALS